MLQQIQVSGPSNILDKITYLGSSNALMYSGSFWSDISVLAAYTTWTGPCEQASLYECIVVDS